MTNVDFYNINNLHLKESDLDSMEEDCFLYKNDEIVVYELIHTIAIISLNDKRYNNINELPGEVRDVVLKEVV